MSDEFDRAVKHLRDAIVAEVQRMSWKERVAWIVGAILATQAIGLVLVKLGWAT